MAEEPGVHLLLIGGAEVLNRRLEISSAVSAETETSVSLYFAFASSELSGTLAVGKGQNARNERRAAVTLCPGTIKGNCAPARNCDSVLSSVFFPATKITRVHCRKREGPRGEGTVAIPLHRLPAQNHWDCPDLPPTSFAATALTLPGGGGRRGPPASARRSPPGATAGPGFGSEVPGLWPWGQRA